MRTKFALLLLTVIAFQLMAWTGSKEMEDEFLLDAVAQYQCLPVFNYAAKMAAVDASPYRPGQPKYAHTTLFYSRCTDTTAHGGKVFGLNVKNDSPYAYDISQPQGQTLVMSTWNFAEVQAKAGTGNMVRMGDSTFLKITSPADFFVMYKAGQTDYPTDTGWIYARVSPDGKRVLQKGLITNCINCHSQSKVDRMLGAH
ncbi:MAG: hypothetical protein JWO06_2476 [Bacteroidota bacterium]|nr:hypothetical protein [Bacteroidota bacterium]